MSSTCYFCQILMQLEFFRQIFGKISSNINVISFVPDIKASFVNKSSLACTVLKSTIKVLCDKSLQGLNV
jgi:hypothetical protein